MTDKASMSVGTPKQTIWGRHILNVTGPCKTSKTQVANRNRGPGSVSWSEGSERFLPLFSSADRWGIVISFHAADCLSQMSPSERAPTGHHQSAWSRYLFHTATLARLGKTFVLWGLPKILTVLGRDSTLILGTFSFSFPW